MDQLNFSFFSNFQGREDLKKYGDNALLLYALQVKYGIDDIDEAAATALVDGYDDKKTDVIYIDPEQNEAVIAQGYFSKSHKTEAPSSKASDLNTAVTWLLARDINDLPERIKSAAKELRRRINDDEIKRITIWYSHNLKESHNVDQELQSAATTLGAILRTHFPEKTIDATYIEVGLHTLEDWYKALTIPILVSKEIIIDNALGYTVIEKDWSCFNSMIHADLIYGLYQTHKSELFSANVRDYLGSRRSDANINNGIKITANSEPTNFYVYNNGITALVNDFKYDKDTQQLTINGLSIVNGAQTTGALGSLPQSPNHSIKIPIRLIKCNSTETIYNIVKYNNSQNKIYAPDFRSSDEVQVRLINEFKELNIIEYSARRGGSTDIIARNPNILPSVTAGQILAAFHNDPSIAYNEKSKIWEQQQLYVTFFNEHTTAKHIIFIYTLLKQIESYKLDLLSKENLTDSEANTLNFLRTRGAVVMTIAAISTAMEEFLNRRIANTFTLGFIKNVSIEKGMELWKPILDIALSFSSALANGLSDGIKNKEVINQALLSFKSFMTAVKGPNSSVLKLFAELVEGH